MASPDDTERRIEALAELVRRLPESPGVYVFRNRDGEEIYVGKALNLASRVRSYFENTSHHDPKTRALVAEIASFDVFPLDSEVEALLLENRLVKELQPRFNINLRDSKDFPYLVITWSEDFPRVSVSRDKPRSGDRYYGPFPHVKELRSALNHLQRVFRFRSCNIDIVEGSPENPRRRPCLNFFIGRCTGPCCARIGREEYRENIRRLSLFISGTGTGITRDLEKHMAELSAALRFEEAAAVRDQITAIRRLGERGSLEDTSHPEVAPIDLSEGLDQLQNHLKLAIRPRLIDGIDISNLGPAETVGAVVTFLEGIPQRGGYRRYRIRTVEGQDDYASMAEVARRRYRRLAEEGSVFPDIVLVDGGIGHLRAVKEALEKTGASGRTLLLSLAKENETVFAGDTEKVLPLPPRSAAKRLLMYVRDEAHRFAQHYHHILRRKFVLDE
ncbi:MAG: excinuclease ABC subunit UvrC [Planctomycetes bacterium]|nr:excinuclease ABC subunit UvrC [Planctomycetota bacterium]